jgi:antitoxin HigA-1
MPMRSRLRTTTKTKDTRKQMAPMTIAKGRLPSKRPPTHPGEMLLEEFLKPLGITQSDFAARLGVSFPRLNEIIRMKRGVTPDTALRLARVLGNSPEFWLGLQLDWDLWNAMQSKGYSQIEKLEPVKYGA